MAMDLAKLVLVSTCGQWTLNVKLYDSQCRPDGMIAVGLHEVWVVGGSDAGIPRKVIRIWFVRRIIGFPRVGRVLTVGATLAKHAMSRVDDGPLSSLADYRNFT